MNPFNLWLRLVDSTPIRPDDGLDDLRSLASVPFPERVAYLGYLPPLTEDPNPAIRAAAVAAFGGAKGYDAIRILRHALDDPDETVRRAAVEALRESALAEDAVPPGMPVKVHARWGHALFHPDALVRRSAMSIDAPPAGPRWHRNYLEADPTPTMRDAVWAAAAAGVVSDWEIESLLGMAEIGAVSPELARRRLATAQPVESWRRWLNWSGRDIHRLFALFADLTPDERGGRPNVRQRFARSFCAGVPADFPRERRKEAVAALRRLYRDKPWPDEFVALAAALVPPILLDESLPWNQRRRALAVAMTDRAVARGYPSDAESMRALFSSNLVRRSDGTPDLDALGCVVAAHPGDPHGDFTAIWDEKGIADEFAARPESAGPLFFVAGHCGGPIVDLIRTRAIVPVDSRVGGWRPSDVVPWGFDRFVVPPEPSLVVRRPAPLTSAEEELAAEAERFLAAPANDSGEPAEKSTATFRRVVELGPRVDAKLRWRIVSARPHVVDPIHTVPLRLAAELEPERIQMAVLNPYLLADVPPEHLVRIVHGVLMANLNGAADEFKLLAWLSACSDAAGVVDAAYRSIVGHGASYDARMEARARIQDNFHRTLRISRLARTFAWGVRLGRVLTGHPFRIELLVGDPLGYTRLNQNVLYITGLPILRGEANAEAIVRGLIVHEYGHHLYHKTPEAMEVWARADAHGLGKLLNLVADEHLERNMRQRDATFGHYLKTLNAYAFQRQTRELPLDFLLTQLGRGALGVLSQIKLGAGRNVGCVAVQNGKLLALMDSGGNSFVRFMRALRMGLGNRSEDPKVAEALLLFKGDFRRSDMQRLDAIARRLAEIFGCETDILNWMNQDDLLTNCGLDVELGEGVGHEELAAAVSKLLRAEGDGAPSGSSRYGLNLGADAEFDRIDNVVKLTYDPAAHRELARKVAREATLLRRSLRNLGLGMRPVRFRTQGRRFDRSRANDLILKGDPRVLWARSPSRFTDLFVGVVVDCSGSMHGPNMDRAKLFAALIAEAIRGLREVDLRLFGFTDRTIYDAGDATRCAGHALAASDGNNDAAGLWHAAQAANRSSRKAKLLVMISDGLPTECTVSALRGLVNALSRRGTCCAQVAVAPISEVCFPNFVLIDDADLSRTVRTFADVVAKLVKKAIG